MRLAFKILVPLLLVVTVLAGMSIGLGWHLREQETTLRDASRQLVGMMRATTELHELQEAIRVNLLSYRFDRKQSRLDAIEEAEGEIARTLSRYEALVNDPKGDTLLGAFTGRRSEVVAARGELIRALQADDAQATRLAFDKWALQNGRLDGNLQDLSAFGVISLEGAVNATIRDQIDFVRASLWTTALAIALALAAFLYVKRSVGRRLALLMADIKAFSLEKIDHRLDETLARSRDEIGMLGRAFSEMAGRLSASYAALRAEVAQRTEAEAGQRRSARLATLMKTLASAANEADAPEEAMRTCLTRICEYGGWTLGRLAIFPDDANEGFPERSFWHPEIPARYPRFVQACADPVYFGAGGRFISIVRRERRPVWMEDLAAADRPGRVRIAYEEGLRSAFAFPVVAHGKLIAFLEFFAEETRAPDTVFMDAIVSVGAQIARVIERSRADAEKDRLNAELEQRVEARTAELQAANRELESFSYSVSHDLRAPLRAIDGFSRLAVEKDGGKLGSDARRYLGQVRANTQQMGALIDDLLAFSRLGRQALVAQRIDTLELVRQSLHALRPEYENKRAILVFGDLPECQGDPVLVKQVWMNLLSNAFKFSGKSAPQCVEIGSRGTNGERVYFVRDNGVGFDMRYADKLFGVFQRLHGAREFPGTGVGLAIVQRIVARHGGRTWAEAERGRGATFYFTLEGNQHHDQPRG